MKKLVYFEWLHFSRNIARYVAVSLFLLAAIFGLYNGISSYIDRLDQAKAIQERTTETREMVYNWFDEGKSGPEGRPWVDINTPFWSIWYANHYLIQQPKPTMIYNIGQSEHFGYYKRVSMWTTAFDDDLTAEIANPELVRLGGLDFTFVWIYLMPLLLIVLTYHTKGLEYDLGFIPLLKIQRPSMNSWFFQRLLITGLGLLFMLSLLILISALALSELSSAKEITSLWLVYALYLALWLTLAYLVIRYGKGQADQALKMVGIWLLLTVAIPGIVNQYVLLKKPADLMMDLIEAGRDGQQKIYNQPQDKIIAQTVGIVPELKETSAAKYDSLLKRPMINGAYRIVLNRYKSGITVDIMQDQVERNNLVASSYWFNPITGFHNWLNRLTSTGHEANLDFRIEIKEAGETINRTLVLDEWYDKKMDKSSFTEYVKLLDPGNHK